MTSHARFAEIASLTGDPARRVAAGLEQVEALKEPTTLLRSTSADSREHGIFPMIGGPWIRVHTSPERAAPSAITGPITGPREFIVMGTA